jgi:hypothetical protein
MPQNIDDTNAQILNTLLEIKLILKEMADRKGANGPITVRVEGGDRAIQDLVNRVLEEILARVKNENILSVTNA